MPGIGTLANVGMILGGSIIGMFLKKGVPERFKTIVFQALGTATFLIGLSGVLSGVLKTNDSGGLDSQYILLLILSLVLGGVLANCCGWTACSTRWGKRSSGRSANRRQAPMWVQALPTAPYCSVPVPWPLWTQRSTVWQGTPRC